MASPYQMFGTPAKFVDNELCLRDKDSFKNDELCVGNIRNHICPMVRFFQNFNTFWTNFFLQYADGAPIVCKNLVGEGEMLVGLLQKRYPLHKRSYTPLVANNIPAHHYTPAKVHLRNIEVDDWLTVTHRPVKRNEGHGKGKTNSGFIFAPNLFMILLTFILIE